MSSTYEDYFPPSLALVMQSGPSRGCVSLGPRQVLCIRDQLGCGAGRPLSHASSSHPARYGTARHGTVQQVTARQQHGYGKARRRYWHGGVDSSARDGRRQAEVFL